MREGIKGNGYSAHREIAQSPTRLRQLESKEKSAAKYSNQWNSFRKALITWKGACRLKQRPDLRTR